MERRLIVGSLLGVLVLAGAGVMLRQPVGAIASGKPLPELGAVPAFVLTDQAGGAFSFRKLENRVWIAGFIFTRCAGQCPMMVEQMQEVARAIDGIPIVAFSVDPEHDTAEVLSAYAKRLGLDASRWHLLTDWPTKATPEPNCPPGEGCLTSTRRVSMEGFHLSAVDGGSPAEPVTHSIRLILVDQRGHVRGYYDATEAEAMARLVRDARQLLSAGRAP